MRFSPSRRWPFATMMLSMCLVVAGLFIASLRPIPGHTADRISITASSVGAVGGVVSWVASRRH